MISLKQNKNVGSSFDNSLSPGQRNSPTKSLLLVPFSPAHFLPSQFLYSLACDQGLNSIANGTGSNEMFQLYCTHQLSLSLSLNLMSILSTPSLGLIETWPFTFHCSSLSPSPLSSRFVLL